LGLYDYNARYYDASIGRFISADVIVPGTSRLTPLTVGFHETMFIEQANIENKQLMLFGPTAAWPSFLKKQFGSAAGPVTTQTLNRYAYGFNNPLLFVDPSGHTPDFPFASTITPVDPRDAPNGEEGWYLFTLSGEGIETISRLIRYEHEEFNLIQQYVETIEYLKENYDAGLVNLSDAKEAFWIGVGVALVGLIVAIAAVFFPPVGWAIAAISIVIAAISVFVAFYYGLPAVWSAQRDLERARRQAHAVLFPTDPGRTGFYVRANVLYGTCHLTPTTCQPVSAP
jgi:hypothetical protein